MNLPAPYNTLSFWKAITFALAGFLTLLGYFDVIPDQYVYSADALLAAVLAVLNFLHVEVEQKAKLAAANLQKTIELVEEAARIRNDLLGAKIAQKQSKSRK